MTQKDIENGRKQAWLKRNHRVIWQLAQEYSGLRDSAIRLRIYCILINQGCQVCNEKDRAALVFHHIIPSQKKFDISNKRFSLPDWLAEIAKCMVLCRNCHSKLHAGHLVLKFATNNNKSQHPPTYRVNGRFVKRPVE